MSWRIVEGYPKYMVSSRGLVAAVWHKKTKMGHVKILKQKTDRDGYLCVRLYNNGKPMDTSVHILVAKSFLCGYSPGLQVNHKDGEKSNNNAWNLEWVTPRENMLHARDHGLLQRRVGESNTQARIKESEVLKIYDAIISGEKHHIIARRFGISRSHVSGIAAGNKWAHVTRIRK